MTQEEAKELCIKKWQWIVDHNGSYMGIFMFIPQLYNFHGACPYCEKYMYNMPDSNQYCTKCPINLGLNPDMTACSQKSHPFYEWFNNPTKENAQKVLDLIIEK